MKGYCVKCGQKIEEWNPGDKDQWFCDNDGFPISKEFMDFDKFSTIFLQYIRVRHQKPQGSEILREELERKLSIIPFVNETYINFNDPITLFSKNRVEPNHRGFMEFMGFALKQKEMDL